MESFNGKMREELLDRELIDTLWEAKTLCGRWVRQYNTVRPHSALGYRPPAPDARMPPALGELISVTQQVVQKLGVGQYGTADDPTNAVGEYVSAAVYNSNYAYLAYYDASSYNRKFVNVSRGGSDPTYLSIGTPITVSSTGSVGKYTSIACSTDGATIYISYYDETNGDLKLAKSINSGVSWTISTVDSTGDVGQYTSIAISGSVVYIAYYDVTNTALKIAKSLDGGATW